MSQQLDLFDQTGFAEDSPARISAWLEDVLDYLATEADCSLNSSGSSGSFLPAGLLSKTSPAFCRSVDAPPAESSSLFSVAILIEETARAARALDAMPDELFYRLIKEEASLRSWERWRNSGMGSPIAFMTLNTSEFHSAAAVCSLSDVLEAGDVPPKYFLSPKACRGILRRAGRRGRELPPALHAALVAMAEVDTPAGEERMM